MPWEEKTVNQNRKEFVSKIISSEKSMSELCREFGISRPTGYKWLNRFMSGEKLNDKSHAPFHMPNKTPIDKEELILQARTRHPTWAARKLKRYLENEGHIELPAISTISNILKRNNCIEPEESIKHTPYKRFERAKPNELWQTDFKGDFAMLNSDRCYPLTVLDDHSRYSLCIDAKANQQAEGVFESFDRLFREHGLPEAILSDNGAPWCDSRNGYTPFELWLMQLDILPIHGRPMHPQTQGKDERFHRTMKQELLKWNVFLDLYNSQEMFDAWRYEYNYERPHEALGLDVPAKHYKESKIKLPEKLREPDYDANCRLRKVNCKGYISINNHRYYISETFISKYLELIDEENDCISLCYGKFKVAKISLTERLFVSRKIYRR